MRVTFHRTCFRADVIAFACAMTIGAGIEVSRAQPAGRATDTSATEPRATEPRATQPRTVERELIFGAELMTDAELDRYRAEIGKLGSDTDRGQYRERHRERLRERARGRGIDLQEPAGVVRRREQR